MKSYYKLIALTASTALFLSGCQTVAMPEISDEDTALVAQYAAEAILSNNKNYNTGIATQAEIEKDDAKRERQRLREEEAKKAKEEELKQKKEKKGGDPAYAEAIIVQNADIAQFLELPNITVTYQDYEICDSYPHDEGQENFFAMDATTGNKLLIVKFVMQNNAAEDQDVDLLYKYPLFRISVNGSEYKNSLTTLLLDDMSTYKATLAAGETTTVVLALEITEEEAASEIQALSLRMKYNGQVADTSLK